MNNDPEPSQEQKDAAALWQAKRAGGSMSAADERAFQGWLDADRGNRLAFDQIRVLWARLEAPSQRLAADRSGRWGARFAARWRSGRIAAGVAAVLLLAVVWGLAPDLMRGWGGDVVSGPALVTEAPLPDGSVAYLAAGSALDVDFAGGGRAVTLVRGQALFDVRHRNGDPFTVAAGSARIQVVGTRFSVDLLPSRTVVGVEEGAVQVHGDAGAPGVLLHPDQQVSVDDGRVGAVAGLPAGQASAWLTGRLSVQAVPFTDLAAMLERSARGRILVLDSVGGRTVSGTFPLDDVPGSLETAAAAVRAEVLHLSPWLTVVY